MLNIDSGLYFCPAHWLEHDVRIALVGCGATGSAIAPLLFKLNHIRRELTGRELGLNLFIFDPKNVTTTGMNRTGFFAPEVGMNKAIVMANKLNTALGYNFAVGYDRPFSASDAGSGFDVVITATDSAKSRFDIQHAVKNQYRRRQEILWLDIGVGEQYGNVVLGQFGHGNHRLPNALDLFPSIASAKDDKALARPSCDVLDAISRQNFTVNEAGATTAVGLLSKLLLNGSISVNGAMYDVETCGSTPIRINRQVWRSFGYNFRKKPETTNA